MPPEGALSDWAHWDGAWYLGLAADGYGGDRRRERRVLPRLSAASCGPRHGCSAARRRSRAWWCRALALLAALLALHAVAREHAGAAAARWSVVALALFPTSFFLGAVYTEALFLAFALGAWWAMRVRRDLVLACVLAAGAALSRNVGVVLVVPLALEWRRQGGSLLVPRAAALLAPVLALAAFATYLGTTFGDPALLVTAAQGVWDRSLAFPVATVVDSVQAANGAWPAVPHLFAGTGTVASFTASHLWNLGALVLAGGLLWAGRRIVPGRAHRVRGRRRRAAGADAVAGPAAVEHAALRPVGVPALHHAGRGARRAAAQPRRRGWPRARRSARCSARSSSPGGGSRDRHRRPGPQRGRDARGQHHTLVTWLETETP